MIKRMSKATSLLVAAAAVVSLLPAMGVSAATKTLETKEGTIDSVIAFNGGSYVFEGYKTQNDATGFYYNNGSKDTLLEDITADSIAKFGSKYAKIEDDSDEYLIDLSTGKVVDQTTQDITDNAKIKLKSALTKTDRYGRVATTDDITLNQITQGQFGENWYSYTTTGESATYSGYVNEAGKYVDTDYLANMYVVNADGTKTVKIEQFGKLDSTNKIKVDLAGSRTIAQDKDFIYRLADVNVTTGTTTSTAVYLQKISKAQGEQQDGAYIPSSVSSYQVSAGFDSDDADAAKTAIDAATDFRVINGNVYAIKNAGDKVTVTVIKLKKDKVTLDNKSDKLDAYLAEKDVDESQDIAATSAVSIDVDGNVWALNKGQIYKFDGAKFNAVYSTDRSFDSLEVYNTDSLVAWKAGENSYATVDKAADNNDTNTNPQPQPEQKKGWVKTDAGWTFYDNAGNQSKGQWINDNGVWYMIKADGVMATGWYNDNGTWYFLNASGAMKTGWVNDNGTWYYLNGSGAMKTGWVNDNGTWYFLNASGSMKTGWLNDNGSWYYLNASGAMLANTTIDGYKLGASGAWVK